MIRVRVDVGVRVRVRVSNILGSGPVYKKGDKHDPLNYRPISLTCICCKLLEHIISSNVMSHLENNNILYDLQHGFRPSRSCETQLISFLQHVSQSNNQNIQTDVR